MGSLFISVAIIEIFVKILIPKHHPPQKFFWVLGGNVIFVTVYLMFFATY
jgi:hypothetical protein